MICNTQRRYTWCPGDPKGREHLILSQWLEEVMEPYHRQWRWWLKWLDVREISRPLTAREFLVHLCELDAPELITLLYPRCPRYFLAPSAFDRFNAVDMCAFLGSSAALEALLELGADPNGLDRLMEARSSLHWDLEGRAFLYQPTPLDLARAEGEEDCCLLLSLYGGVTAEELFSIPQKTLPVLLPTPSRVAPAPQEIWKTWSVPEEDTDRGEG